MDDLISRQDASDTLETVGYDFSNSELSETELVEVCEAVGEIRQDMINRIKKMPSVQSERKRGKWVWNENGMDWGLGAWVCSVCRSKPETWWESDKKNNPLRCSGSHFCGNCGADMREDEE